MLSILVAVFVASWTLWATLKSFLSSSTLDDIPGPPAQSWLTGSLLQLISHTGWEFHRNIAKTYGGVARIKGFVGANMLYVHDPKALHHILVKDQHIYEEEDGFIEGNRLIFGEGLLSSLGERHRLQRKMLNPAFSISNMREMAYILYDVAHKVETTFMTKTKNGPREVDIVAWMTRLALELIAQSGLGYTFDALSETSEPHPYGAASKQLTPATTHSWIPLIHTIIVPKFKYLGPARCRRWLVDILPIKSLQKFRDIVDTLHETSLEIYEAKKRAFEAGDETVSEKIGKGRDIISILMKENMKAEKDERLSKKELLGQISSLTFAATDTTSAALSRTLHQLALYPEVQAAVRQEIRDARTLNGGKDLGYDTLVALPLLDAICRETLRLFPPAATLSRIARQVAILPLTNPIKDINGKHIQEITVPRDTEIHISILASNTNPEFWGPDSYEWKPERWLHPLPEALVTAKIPGVYSPLMTFLAGGRACIGFTFSQLEMKIVLAVLLESLEFSVSEKKIVWLMSTIATCNVEGNESSAPSLPMVVSLAK